jgi:hypothetical protein
MSDDLYSGKGPEAEIATFEKKKKLWRNIFLLNLCISVLLIGFFWVPIKFVQMEQFLNSPSVNLPEEGEPVKPNIAAVPVPVPNNANLLTTKTVTINASSEKDWSYFDLSRGTVVNIHDPSSLEWDLAFRREKVISNGGATNKFGKAGLILLKEIEFDAVANVPTENYINDTSTRTETENKVLLDWRKYNYFTHKLTPKKLVFALRTADNKFAKIQFKSLYCANKETGCITMQYVYQKNGSNSFEKNAIGLASTTPVPAPAPQGL